MSDLITPCDMTKLTLSPNTPLSSPLAPTACPHIASSWKVSPGAHLRVRDCPCTTSRPFQTTGGSQLATQLKRFHKIWRRVSGSSTPPAEVQDAATHLLLELRNVGLERFHWIARQISLPAGDKRNEHSILLLVPSPDAPSGHRWVGEILVHQYLRGSRKGKIENVATRTSDDPEDWTSTMDHTYLDVPETSPVYLPVQKGASTAMVLDSVWSAVALFLGGEDLSSKKRLERMIGRASAAIRTVGRRVDKFEVALRIRQSRAGRGSLPTIFVSIYAAPLPSAKKEDLGERSNGQVKWSLADATILIDPLEGSGTKPMAICYAGCWPLVHYYRTRFPSPNFEDWASLIKKSRSSERPEPSSRRSSTTSSSLTTPVASVHI